MTRHLLALALLLGGCPSTTGKGADTDDTTVDTDDTAVDTDDTAVAVDSGDTDPVIDDSGDTDPTLTDSGDTDTGDSDVIVPHTGDSGPADTWDTDPGDSSDTDPGDTWGPTDRDTWDSFVDTYWDSFADSYWDSSADSFGRDSAGRDSADSGVMASQWGPATCLIFDASTWTYHRTANNPLNVPTNTSTLTLTPDDLEDAGAAVMSTADFVAPYRVTFQYRTYDDDGGSSFASRFNSADGLALLLRKDRTAYGTPPSGGALGVINDGTGHSVQFKTYDNRGIAVEDEAGTQLFFQAENSVYTSGTWRSVSVEVYVDRMVVRYRGDRVFDQAITWAPGFDAIGFSAGTGGADSEHQVRDVCISAPL